jgi:beta-lactamase class A
VAASLEIVAGSLPSVFAAIDSENLTKVMKSKSQIINGTLGVAAYDLQTEQAWYWNEGQVFRMQSVEKLLVAIAVLKKVDQRSLSLQNLVPVSSAEVAEIRGAAIPDPLPPKTRSVPLEALLQKSICNSNNGASDVLMKLAGGPQVVDKLIASFDISGIRVDRYEREVIRVESLTTPEATKLDTATPKAMCDLLVKLQNGKLLSPATTKFLLKLMAECKTGNHRIRAGLPAGTLVMDKTGTGGSQHGRCSATNDVAIAVLPGGQKFVIAVFLANAGGSAAKRDQVIASVSSSIYQAIVKPNTH